MRDPSKKTALNGGLVWVSGEGSAFNMHGGTLTIDNCDVAYGTSGESVNYVGGGNAPNIVPDKASGWYYVRAATVKTLNEVYERMCRIAQGAALMTDTKVLIEDQGGCYPTMPNHTLADVLYAILQTVPQEPWTQEELDFAAALNQNPDLPHQLFPGGVSPKTYGSSGGSSDVGDVQHVSPGVFFYTACRNIGCVGHTWQATACSGHSIGLKGMLYAAKIMAIFGSRVMTDPELLRAAKQEFAENSAKEPYECLFPADFPIPE